MLLNDRNYPKDPIPEVLPEKAFPEKAAPGKATPGLEAARKQVDRILTSDTLHASEVLRKFLRFLADKSFSGEAADLKEYSVGVDALGKPPTYDPRQDAGVRIQASRLRQKLDEYYRTEGSNDPLVIELPRGRFKIVWRPNVGGSLPGVIAPAMPIVAEHAGQSDPTIAQPGLKKWRRLAIGLAVTSMALVVVCTWALLPAAQTVVSKSAAAVPAPELDALWSPFLSSTHHMIIGFIDPLFVRLERKGSPDIVYRTRGNNSWNDAIGSPEFSVLTRSLGNPVATPTFNMVERSSLMSAFILSQFFVRRHGDISLARSAQLSWQQFADNDVILFAPLKIDEGVSALPVRPVLIVDKSGVRNLQPLPGEPAVYADPPDHQESDGEGLELVSVLPGPLGRTTVMTFSSNHAWGVIGGVESLTEPAFVRLLVKKLKETSGKIPRYYQMVFRIRYRDGTPTNASYVTHRELVMTENPVETRAAR